MTRRWPVLGRRRLLLQLALSLGIALLAAAALAFITGHEELRAAASRVSPGLFAVLLLLSSCNYLLRGLRWHGFTRALGLQVPVWRNVQYYLAGLSMVFSPGKVGEVVRLWFLSRGHGYPVERTAALLIADRVSDLFALILLVLPMLFLLTGLVWPMLIACLLIAATGLALMLPSTLPSRAVHIAYRMLGWKPRWFVRIRRAVIQFERLAERRAYYPALLLSLLGWLAEVAGLFLLLAALGTPLNWGESTLAFCGSLLVGAATLLPGGLGGTEASLTGLLTLFGVAMGTALAATVIIRAVTLWFAFLVGAIMLPLVLLKLGGAAGDTPAAVHGRGAPSL